MSLNKWYYSSVYNSMGLKYLIVFLVGQAIMVLEITGAKVIAPILGASHIIWVVQITLTLLALALGAFLYTKIKNNKVVIGLLGVAGFYSLVITPVISNLVYLFLNFSLETAIILSSIILYLFPLTVLGMIFSMIAEIIKKEDFLIGKLSAFSTLGSVVGSLLSGFIAIHWFSNKQILLLNSLVIILVYLLLGLNKRKIGIFLVAIFAVYSLFKESNNKINSLYGEIEVINKNGTDQILNDGLIQNTYNYSIKNSLSLFTYALEYFSYKHGSDIKKAFHIGLGIGVVANNFVKKDITNKIVEINPEMVKLSKKYFNLNNIVVGDGRYHIKKEKEKYDVIILDAFLVDSVPINLLSKEAFSEMKKIMTNKGVVVINSFGTVNPPSILTQSIYKTLKNVFQEVKVYSIDDFNVFYVAGDSLNNNFNVEMNIPWLLEDDFNDLKRSEISLKIDKGILITDSNSLLEVIDDSPRFLYRKKQVFK